jgi:sugar/nucleoside kinase (ribokinase family)
MRRANAAAALSVSGRGAIDAMPTAIRVNALLSGTSR